MSPNEDTDNIIAEYNQLYAEIGRNSQITQYVFLANVTATAILIGYGLNTELGTIFLSPFAVIIPSLFFLASQLESTTRIASYIKVFLESDSKTLNWETKWMELRAKSLLPHRRKYTLSLSGIYGLLSISCIVLAVIYWEHDFWILVAVTAPIVALVYLGISSLIRAFSIEFCKTYEKKWEKLRQSYSHTHGS